LTPGNSVSVQINASSASACGAGTTYTWTPDVRQDNNFNGQGNELTLDTSPGASQLNTTVSPPCGFKFDPNGEPADAFVNTAITTIPYNSPSQGGPVMVDALDALGNTMTSYKGPVSVSLNSPSYTNPSPAVLSGTTTVNAVSGVATFSNLSVNAQGNGYTLTPSSTASPNSANNSSSFDIHNTGTDCSNASSGSTCTSTASSTTGGSTGAVTATITATAGSGASPTILSESIDFQKLDPSLCGNVPEGHTVFYHLDNETGWTQTSSITTFNPPAGFQQEVCLFAPKQFMQKTIIVGVGVVLQPATPTTVNGVAGFQGLEPDCGNPAINVLTVDCTQQPGVSSRVTNPDGSKTTKSTIPPGFDPTHYN
jgi:hypothetical protein